jgi:hypothetical protein
MVKTNEACWVRVRSSSREEAVGARALPSATAPRRISWELVLRTSPPGTASQFVVHEREAVDAWPTSVVLQLILTAATLSRSAWYPTEPCTEKRAERGRWRPPRIA